MNQPDITISYKEMAELERRRLVAVSLRSTLSALNSDLPLDQLLDFIVHQALPLLSADAVAIHRLNSDDELVIQSVVGLSVDHIQSAGPVLEKITTRKAYLSRQPVFCTNLSEILNKSDFCPAQVDSFEGLTRKYRSILSVPIEIRNESYGVLTLFFVKRHKLNDDELDLAIDFSIQAALAIDNARLRLNAQLQAVNQERNRLARELHDSVIQNLFSASLIAESLPKVFELDPAQGLEGLSELQLLTRGALAEMRSLLLELRPRAIEEAHLEELIRQIAEAASGRLRKPVTYYCDNKTIMPVDVRLTFYRITQEAINNIIKHAEADNISIVLKQDGKSPDGRCKKATLTITDDGRGFVESKDSPFHLGFKIMKERAELIGAKLSIKSQIDQGTTVRLKWVNQDLETT
jgi:signal transduction histidine kinase